MLNRVLIVLAAALLIVFGISANNDEPAEAVQPGFICEDLDSGKIDTVGDPATVERTAPDGFLISGYCVKAGTEKFFIVVDPPQKVVIVDHPVKDSVSHYSLEYVEIPKTDPTPTPTPTSDPTPTPTPTPEDTELPTLPLPEDPSPSPTPGPERDILAATGPEETKAIVTWGLGLTSVGLLVYLLSLWARRRFAR